MKIEEMSNLQINLLKIGAFVVLLTIAEGLAFLLMKWVGFTKQETFPVLFIGIFVFCIPLAIRIISKKTDEEEQTAGADKPQEVQE